MSSAGAYRKSDSNNVLPGWKGYELTRMRGGVRRPIPGQLVAQNRSVSPLTSSYCFLENQYDETMNAQQVARKASNLLGDIYERREENQEKEENQGLRRIKVEGSGRRVMWKTLSGFTSPPVYCRVFVLSTGFGCKWLAVYNSTRLDEA
jgi:hypothetical protein